MIDPIKRKKRYSDMETQELIKRALDAVPYLESYEHRNILNEMSHRLGESTATIWVDNNKLVVTDLFGRNRNMSIKERLLFSFFGVLPEGVVHLNTVE